MKKIIFSVLGFIFIMLFLLGIITENKGDIGVSAGEGIVYSLDEIPSDYQKVSQLSIRQKDIICAISKGLVSMDLDENIHCELAEDYSISDDGIEYTFDIREDIYWSDGSKITCEDIIDFFKEVIKLEDEEDITALLDVYGARNYRNGYTSFKDGVAMQCFGNTIKIRLNKKNDNFIYELAKPQYRLKKSLLLWNDLKKYYSDIKYSGDYTIKYMSDSSVQLNGNQTITFTKDENSEVAIAAFELGKRDIVPNVGESAINKLSKHNKLLTIRSDTGLYMYMNKDLSLDKKKNMFKKVYDVFKTYFEEHNNEFSLLEGRYMYVPQENIEVLQDRKVIINSTDIYDNNIEIYTDNSSIQKYLKDSNEIKLKTMDTEKLLHNISSDNYEVAIIELKNNSISNNKFFEDALSIYPYIDSVGDYTIVEDELFNNYYIMPLIIYNCNVAISNEAIIKEIDYYGNIYFN